MTNLFDATLQHIGWSGGTFASGGWEDWSAPIATGRVAGSYWAHVLNGVAIDQAAQLVEGGGTRPVSAAYWFNTHTNAELAGPSRQPGYLVTPNTRLYTYTRVSHSNDAILWRIIVSDQGATPAPTNPP